MTILHYVIGLPPQRHGGSVQYAYDLMMEQSKSVDVVALTCGDTLFRTNKCKIRKKGKQGNVDVYSLTNPLTPTLIYGIKNPSNQYRDVNIDYGNIRDFILDNKIDVMHLHTLMGIHKDIVGFIKSLVVKIIYTTHDFHGLCPRYNFIDNNGQLCCEINDEKCAACNVNEPSDLFLRLANSSLFHILKRVTGSRIYKKPRSISRLSVISSNISDHKIDKSIINDYRHLLEYYQSYFKLVDKFHFNSSQTKDVFKRFIPEASGETIPVITKGINDKRHFLSPRKDIKFGFIGNLNKYKGFPILKKVATELYDEGIRNFKVIVYGGTSSGIDSDCSTIEYMPPYDYSIISDILYGLDCIVVPSVWYETFSLVTLEALSHGIPAIVSDHVGAKDIVASYKSDCIFHSTSELKQLMKMYITDPHKLIEYNQEIMISDWNFSLASHAEIILDLYK